MDLSLHDHSSADGCAHGHRSVHALETYVEDVARSQNQFKHLLVLARQRVPGYFEKVHYSYPRFSSKLPRWTCTDLGRGRSADVKDAGTNLRMHPSDAST